MMDTGCYPISLSRFLFDRAERVFGDVETRGSNGPVGVGDPDFGSGTSTFTCSTQLAPIQRVHIFGTEGRVRSRSRSTRRRTCRARCGISGAEIEEIQLDTCIGRHPGRLVRPRVLDDAEVPTPIEDAVANMRVIEAVFRSSESGRFETM